MQDGGKYTAPTEQIYGFMNYEQLLSRAVDRCLHYRCVAIEHSSDYIFSVQALSMSLVDIRGKPMKSDLEKAKPVIMNTPNTTVIERYDCLFQEITSILAKHKMLFKSVLVEVGREQS